jgi:hypothetical protein
MATWLCTEAATFGRAHGGVGSEKLGSSNPTDGRNRVAGQADNLDGYTLDATAASLGDRLVMMHRGRIIHDAWSKKRARADDRWRAEEVRRRDELDETAAEMLRRVYI